MAKLIYRALRSDAADPNLWTGASSGYVEGFRLPSQLSASRGAGSGSGPATQVLWIHPSRDAGSGPRTSQLDASHSGSLESTNLMDDPDFPTALPDAVEISSVEIFR